MATPTANYGFIKDAPTQLYDVQVVNANLDAIDAQIKARETAIASNNTSLDARLDVLESYFKADVASLNANPFTSAGNWQLTEEKVWTWGPIAFGNLTVQRKTSTLTSPADGNITNEKVVTWNMPATTYLRPYNGGEASWNPSSGGPLFSGFVTQDAIYLGALSPGSAGNINVGETLYGSFIYFRNMPGT